MYLFQMIASYSWQLLTVTVPFHIAFFILTIHDKVGRFLKWSARHLDACFLCNKR